jgi:ribA/ribD-fused uncharacterized protein
MGPDSARCWLRTETVLITRRSHYGGEIPTATHRFQNGIPYSLARPTISPESLGYLTAIILRMITTMTISEGERRRGIRVYDANKAVVFRKTNEPFGGLSNMAPGFPLNVNSVLIRTSEALYQACRFPHMSEVQRLIIDQASPMTAKMKSKPFRTESRSDWNQIRVDVMRWCLRVKLVLNWESFRLLLLETGSSDIVEDSAKDDFWGAIRTDNDVLQGRNILGRLLMELREHLKADEAKFDQVEPLKVSDFLLYGTPISTVRRAAPAVDVSMLPEPRSHSALSHQAMLFPVGDLKIADSALKPSSDSNLHGRPEFQDNSVPQQPNFEGDNNSREDLRLSDSPTIQDEGGGQRRSRLLATPSRDDWPSQDGVDRSHAIAIIAHLAPLGKIDKSKIEVNRWHTLSADLQEQLATAVDLALRQLGLPESEGKVGAERYQIGPAAEGLFTSFIATVWDHRDHIALIASGTEICVITFRLVRMVKRRLDGWTRELSDPDAIVELALPPEVLADLCEYYVRKNYHPRAALHREWTAITQEFYAGYRSPAHPTADMEYLVTVRTKSRTYAFEVLGSGIVTSHHQILSNTELPLPLPNLMRGSLEQL